MASVGNVLVAAVNPLLIGEHGWSWAMRGRFVPDGGDAHMWALQVGGLKDSAAKACAFGLENKAECVQGLQGLGACWLYALGLAIQTLFAPLTALFAFFLFGFSDGWLVGLKSLIATLLVTPLCCIGELALGIYCLLLHLVG